MYLAERHEWNLERLSNKHFRVLTLPLFLFYWLWSFKSNENPQRTDMKLYNERNSKLKTAGVRVSFVTQFSTMAMHYVVVTSYKLFWWYFMRKYVFRVLRETSKIHANIYHLYLLQTYYLATLLFHSQTIVTGRLKSSYFMTIFSIDILQYIGS